MLMLRRGGRRRMFGVLEEWQLQNMHFQAGIAGQARKSRFVYMCNEHTPMKTSESLSLAAFYRLHLTSITNIAFEDLTQTWQKHAGKSAP
jgi:hypothetical protein